MRRGLTVCIEKHLFADSDGQLLATVVLEAVHGLDVQDHGDGEPEGDHHYKGHHQTRPGNKGPPTRLQSNLGGYCDVSKHDENILVSV